MAIVIRALLTIGIKLVAFVTVYAIIGTIGSITDLIAGCGTIVKEDITTEILKGLEMS